ncbi:hypothetical protein OAH36_03825 [Verrucomicrobia bacterium]|jgi:hypothetical protein|nr:hypothetical protein [Verrucomicrobiota bacterium]MDB4746289.1 hypothetical protein [Verrucomicrobiota bacterium]MDB4798707.1 hypothetical protein [Verrucomicrobiota bacterium]
MDKKVCHKTFDATLKSWDQLFAEAAEFASMIGQERLISISHSDSHSRGVVAVWYWSE